jgi:hypothetical protein
MYANDNVTWVNENKLFYSIKDMYAADTCDTWCTSTGWSPKESEKSLGSGSLLQYEENLGYWLQT